MHAFKCEQAYLFQSGPDIMSGRSCRRQGGTSSHRVFRSYCRRPVSVPGGTECDPQHHRPTPEGQRTHAVAMPQPSSAAVSAAVTPDRESPCSPCGIRTDLETA